MNREMREVERWNDPAAEFLSVGFSFLGMSITADWSEEEKVQRSATPEISRRIPDKSVQYPTGVQMGRCG